MARVFVASHGRYFNALGNVQCGGRMYPYIIDWDSHPFSAKHGKTYIVLDGEHLRLLVTEDGTLRFIEADECVKAFEELRLANRPLPDISIVLRYLRPGC